MKWFSLHLRMVSEKNNGINNGGSFLLWAEFLNAEKKEEFDMIAKVTGLSPEQIAEL